MRLTFSNARLDENAPAPPFTFWLGPVGTIEVTIGGAPFYRDEEFPIVELAISLEEWLESDKQADFSFVSVESDGQPVWWARARSDGWHVGALDQLFDDDEPHDRSEIERTFAAYVQEVDAWMQAKLGATLVEVRSSLRGH